MSTNTTNTNVYTNTKARRGHSLSLAWAHSDPFLGGSFKEPIRGLHPPSPPSSLNRGTAQKFCEIHRSVESGDPAGRLKLDSVEMMMMITVKMIWAMTNEARQMNDDDNDERRLHLNDDVDEGGMSVESG